jgi:hypothetical protein
VFNTINNEDVSFIVEISPIIRKYPAVFDGFSVFFRIVIITTEYNRRFEANFTRLIWTLIVALLINDLNKEK